MTRVLSELLGIEHLQLAQTLQSLEAASGRRGHDIRLTTEVAGHVRQKLQQLGLDPHDTTPEELRQALSSRLQRDEGLLRGVLHISSGASPAHALDAIAMHLTEKQYLHTSFALKASVAKRLLRKMPPKRAMKLLGYRSLDSLLKHEPMPSIYAAAWLGESLAWRGRFLAQYDKLTPSDFEVRRISLTALTSPRWQKLGQELADMGTQTVAVFNDLAAIVLLPVSELSNGQVIATTALALNAANDVASVGSYMKLQQVQPNFGNLAAEAAQSEPLTNAELSGQPVAWRLLHQFYARLSDRPDALAVFEPHVQASDLGWRSAEETLADIHPALEFWQDTQYSALTAGGETVSLNILDVAMSAAPGQLQHFMAKHLWQELQLRYLDPINVEHALATELSPDAAKLA